MLLDIVILPPINLRRRFRRIVLRADGICKSSCLVDNKKLIPHCSLFHMNISAARIPGLYKIVKRLSVFYSVVRLESEGCHINEQWWLDFPLVNYGLLKRFRANIIKQCTFLRMGTMPPWQHRRLTSQEKMNRKKYGVSYSPDVYKPHLTIGKFDSKCISLVSKYLQKIKLSFKADTVAICQVNKNWQVTKIIKQFKVK